MKQTYSDIISRIKDPPLWWDEKGVPRYDPFHPYDLNCIYISEAVLFLIRCQACGKQFEVAATSHILHDTESLALDIVEHRLHYGDPPNIGCCAAGPTMSSEPIVVLQFWRKEHGEWRQYPDMKGKPLE